MEDKPNAGRSRSATSEPVYTDEEVAFMKALDRYKRVRKRPYPTWTEVLAVIKASGYRLVATQEPMPEAPGNKSRQQAENRVGKIV